jgi:opacity protein-like surface antigen
MKKLFTVLVLVMLVASFAAAQDVTGVGPKVQLNMANLSGDIADAMSSKMALKFGVGGFVTVSLIPELDLQGEILFNQKGAKADPDFDLTLSYLDINILAKYPITIEGSDIKPAVFAGPQIGILVSGSADPGGVDVKDDFESLDYGLIVGAGVTIPIEDGAIVADVRFNLGLANIQKTNGSIQSTQNQVISLSVGYAFKP